MDIEINNMLKKKKKYSGTPGRLSVEHVIFNLEVVSSSPTFGIEITFFKNGGGRERPKSRIETVEPRTSALENSLEHRVKCKTL